MQPHHEQTLINTANVKQVVLVNMSALLRHIAGRQQQQRWWALQCRTEYVACAVNCHKGYVSNNKLHSAAV